MPRLPHILLCWLAGACSPCAAAGGPILTFPMDEGKGAALADAAGGRRAEVAHGGWAANAHRAALRFDGRRLVLNIDTSAMGECRVGLLDAAGDPIPGFEADACDPIHANDVAKGVAWAGREDVSALAGKPVRLHFFLRAAKLYAFQFE